MFKFTVASPHQKRLTDLFSTNNKVKDMIIFESLSFQSENIFMVDDEDDSLYIDTILNDGNIAHYIDIE